MAALTLDFGSPKTASVQEIQLTGKIGTDSPTYAVTITLDVLDNITTPLTPTHRYFYVTKEYLAGADFSTTPDEVYMAITPRLTANELLSTPKPVTLLISGDGGSFEGAMIPIA
ncbi:hypothetical protein G9F73_013075 [Clostridium estertheticum]|uniref:hypothetical protein n=1 Tax=Clostridium estertheticum TaxID=238834 RepID=UPI0013EED7D9|nr:hypothetical protein [Clostridium estertheticum]MBZ9608741.1 hypothetical protein [Clostridium estertheticum]